MIEQKTFYVDLRHEIEASCKGDALEKLEYKLLDGLVYHIINIQTKEEAFRKNE